VNVQLWMWLAVVAVILVMLAVDIVAHRSESEISVKEALAWSVGWVSVGITFGAIVWACFGQEFGEQYFSGFVIEKSLAVDNVFIWALIFSSFGVPRKYQHRILFLGVIGALVFRGALIAAGAYLLESFAWIIYVFAAFLIFTGIRMVVSRDSHSDPTESKFYRWFSKTFRSTDKIYGPRLLVRKSGIVWATPLLGVLALVELTDIVFAVDSIPAIFAVTEEPFLVFTANAFAILGLRAMYFLLADLIHRFTYLKLGLSVILVWVGVKMALHHVVKIPTSISLLVIVTILVVAIVASLRSSRGSTPPAETSGHGGNLLREASAQEVSELQPLLVRGSKGR